MFAFIKVFLILTSAFVVENIDPPSWQQHKKWWGPSHLRQNHDSKIKPFKISFHPEMIKDLKYRLQNHRPLTLPLEGENFQYGFNTEYLQTLVDYWANDYDFSAREKYLNQYPQYMTNIFGINIHFLRVKPRAPDHVTVLPLLLLHGFPGSVVEFYKVIPILTTYSQDRNFALELIIPSLPGFGFSEGAQTPGLGAPEAAVVFEHLMHRLGHDKFYVQGGSWGSLIGTCMATLFPEKVLGFHTNFALTLNPTYFVLLAIGSVFRRFVVQPELANRMYPLSEHWGWLIRETGYLHLQATKPDTIGVAMADSPVGLLAYTLQLFSSFSRRKFVDRSDGGLPDLFSRDELLDNLMMYWVPNSFTTAARIYAETINKRNKASEVYVQPTYVPTWTIHAKHEIIFHSSKMLGTKFLNIVNSTILYDYGHFLALEAPGVFANDVFKALTAFQRRGKRSRDSPFTFNILG